MKGRKRRIVKKRRGRKWKESKSKGRNWTKECETKETKEREEIEMEEEEGT